MSCRKEASYLRYNTGYTFLEDNRLDKAVLALEDGCIFEGSSFGARSERSGEVVFNTAITGYQEVFTDPSYAGQIVILTYPQIGNYGSNRGDDESAHPFIEGLAVREFSPMVSNWRSQERADEFLARTISERIHFAVADFYQQWRDLTDEEVLDYLNRVRTPHL